jgi:uncharacterized protein YggE
VYPEERMLPNGQPVKQRMPTAWRVGQYLEVTTTNLDKLPKTVAAAQKILTLNSINFGLTPETAKSWTISALPPPTRTSTSVSPRSPTPWAARSAMPCWTRWTSKVRAITPSVSEPTHLPMAMRMKAADAVEVAEPSFEPGETTLQMQVVGKVRFK